MNFLLRAGAAFVLAASVLLGFAGIAAAGTSRDYPPRGFVFVQTDNPSGNEVVSYDRAPDGALTYKKAYPTGGLGGVLSGSVVDHLASQGSLAIDEQEGLLFAVNAGSNDVSVFAVNGDELKLEQIVPSFGAFPASIAVRGDVVYVLNALDGGSIQGYIVAFGHLVPIGAWNRPLGLSTTATPQFTNTPGQVAFSPDGSQLLVTTKANGSDIDVFSVGPFGALSSTPTVNSEPGAVPFAVSFDRSGDVVVANAGPNSVTSYTLHADGTLAPISTVLTGQSATCWIASRGDGSTFFVSNAGSATLSTVVSSDGNLSIRATTDTDPGTVDAAATVDGRFLYVQTGGSGILDEFAIGPSGDLSKIGSLAVPGAVGGEGIVAS